MLLAESVIAAVVALLVVIIVIRSVRIVPRHAPATSSGWAVTARRWDPV